MKLITVKYFLMSTLSYSSLNKEISFVFIGFNEDIKTATCKMTVFFICNF